MFHLLFVLNQPGDAVKIVTVVFQLQVSDHHVGCVTSFSRHLSVLSVMATFSNFVSAVFQLIYVQQTISNFVRQKSWNFRGKVLLWQPCNNYPIFSRCVITVTKLSLAVDMKSMKHYPFYWTRRSPLQQKCIHQNTSLSYIKKQQQRTFRIFSAIDFCGQQFLKLVVVPTWVSFYFYICFLPRLHETTYDINMDARLQSAFGTFMCETSQCNDM